MLLHEANARLKTPITSEQLDKIHGIYCVLDFSKDDFCKLVDAIGIDKWTEKTLDWINLSLAQYEMRVKEKYLANKRRIEDMEKELQRLETQVKEFEYNTEKFIKND